MFLIFFGIKKSAALDTLCERTNVYINTLGINDTFEFHNKGYYVQDGSQIYARLLLVFYCSHITQTENDVSL